MAENGNNYNGIGYLIMMYLFRSFRFIRFIGFLFVVMLFFSQPLYAPIPETIRLNAVFDYDDSPIHGFYDVVVRLYIDDDDNVEVDYKEVVSDVEFYYGVASIDIGGEGSDLINELFDDPDITIKISVLQHHLEFPLTSVPYAIRTLESNMGRRLDDESIMMFLEDEQRIGINNLTPEVTLDVNGGIRIQNILDSDTIEDGVLYWDSTLDEFYVYFNEAWKTLSFVPTEYQISKWLLDADLNSIIVTRSVGIGMPPGSFSLAVTQDVQIDGDLLVMGSVNITSNIVTYANNGFSDTGELTVPNLYLSSGNSWVNGDLVFSGIMYGDGENLTNLDHFGEKVFGSEHISDDSIASADFQEGVIQSVHFQDLIIGIEKIATNQIAGDLIASNQLQTQHVEDGALQAHHFFQDSITSEDIKHNVFKNDKFVDDLIMSHHIVDGEITASKIKDRNILSSHIIPNSITSDKIQYGTIEGHHIPTNSILLDSLDEFALPLSKGGTGSDSFDNYGVVFTANDAFVNDGSYFEIQDGRMGVGGASDEDVYLFIQDESDTELAIISDYNGESSLLMGGATTWNVLVNASGVLSISDDDQTQVSFSYDNNMGVGTLDPSESLYLTGEIVLGAAVSDNPGTIQYLDGQFLARTASDWHPLTDSSVSLRYFELQSFDELVASSVLYSKNSILQGQNHFIESVDASNISGDQLVVSNVHDTTIYGENSQLNHTDHLTGRAQQSLLGHISFSEVFSDRSQVQFIEDSTLSLMDSSISFLTDASVSSFYSNGGGIDSSRLILNESNVHYVRDAQLTADRAMVSHVFSSDIQVADSIISQQSSVVGEFFSSMILNANQLSGSLVDSLVYNVQNGTINGHDITVFGGDSHAIDATRHISLGGDSHSVNSDRSLAIGQHISIDHDDVTLINASDQLLRSDRDGQLKIQADGGLRLQFSDSMSIAMSDVGGSWATVSDRNLKTAQINVDIFSILDKLKQLPIKYWEYKSEPTFKHVGPTAQDFYQLFEYGNSTTVIHSIDSDGVLVSAIQGLNESINHTSELLTLYEGSLNDNGHLIADVAITLDDLKTRLNRLDRNYQRNQNMVSNFRKDQYEQEKMIQYMTMMLDRLEIKSIFQMLESYIGYIGLIVAGICFGVGIGRFIERGSL